MRFSSRCRLGWQGPKCKQCAVLPGCVHGTCQGPLECRCEPGWTGLLCQTRRLPLLIWALSYPSSTPAITLSKLSLFLEFISNVSPSEQRFARKDAAENTAVAVARVHVGVAWAGQVRTAPNASLIPAVSTVPVNGRGSADARQDGRVIYATRSWLTATSIRQSVATTRLVSAWPKRMGITGKPSPLTPIP